jgi:hypothetical protein
VGECSQDLIKTGSSNRVINAFASGVTFPTSLGTEHSDVLVAGNEVRRDATLRANGCDLQFTGDHRVVAWRRDHLRTSIMNRISERQSLTREEKFVALVHLYVELRLPFDAALDAAEADLLHEQNKGPKETARRDTSIRNDLLTSDMCP